MEFSADNVDQLYHEAWARIRTSGVEERTRNGRVLTIPEPVMMTLTNPRNRVLLDPTRDCNPFFHLAEVVWMLAGDARVEFPAAFNSRYREYAEENGRVHGAYGHRWRHHFDYDQITTLLWEMQRAPLERRWVLQMWDPRVDLHPSGARYRDHPCNTSVMFRVSDTEEQTLDMLVTNRSNDLVWGALGANVVHFTYLHEMFANSLGFKLGKYRVVTNNLHVYVNMPRYAELRKASMISPPPYPKLENAPIGWGRPGRDGWDRMKRDCEMLVNMVALEGETEAWDIYTDDLSLNWSRYVALPILKAYLAGPGRTRMNYLEDVQDPLWHHACTRWVQRRAPGATVANS